MGPLEDAESVCAVVVFRRCHSGAQPLCLGVEGQRNRNGADVVEVREHLLGWHLSSYPDEPGKLYMHLLAFYRVNFLKGIFFDMTLLGLVIGGWCFLIYQDLV